MHAPRNICNKWKNSNFDAYLIWPLLPVLSLKALVNLIWIFFAPPHSNKLQYVEREAFEIAANFVVGADAEKK